MWQWRGRRCARAVRVRGGVCESLRDLPRRHAGLFCVLDYVVLLYNVGGTTSHHSHIPEVSNSFRLCMQRMFAHVQLVFFMEINNNNNNNSWKSSQSVTKEGAVERPPHTAHAHYAALVLGSTRLAARSVE